MRKVQEIMRCYDGRDNHVVKTYRHSKERVEVLTVDKVDLLLAKHKYQLLKKLVVQVLDEPTYNESILDHLRWEFRSTSSTIQKLQIRISKPLEPLKTSEVKISNPLDVGLAEF